MGALGIMGKMSFGGLHISKTQARLGWHVVITVSKQFQVIAEKYHQQLALFFFSKMVDSCSLDLKLTKAPS